MLTDIGKPHILLSDVQQRRILTSNGATHMKPHFLFSNTELECTKMEASTSQFALNFTSTAYFSFIITALYDECHNIPLLQYLEQSV
jgi:hypothetical protein